MSALRHLPGCAWAALRGYASDPRPRVAAANWIALMVAWNQPFYPLYVLWIVGPGWQVSLLTWLSTPFFLAVPAVARRNGRAGRALLPLAGLGNTVLATWAFGPAAGTELFLLPCALLPVVLFGRGERWWSAGLVALALAALALHPLYPAPLLQAQGLQILSLRAMHAVSAGCLLVAIGLVFSRRALRASAR